MFSCCFQHPERNRPGAAFDSKTVLVFGMRQQQILLCADHGYHQSSNPLDYIVHIPRMHPGVCVGKTYDLIRQDIMKVSLILYQFCGFACTILKLRYHQVKAWALIG